MMNSKKAFELSINMIVVMILGLAMMGVGISIFYKTYNQVVDIRENVDSQTQRQLIDLLDTGEAIVVPINNKEGERGDYVDFDIGISNELGGDRQFYLFVRFDDYFGTRADDDGDYDDLDELLSVESNSQPSCREKSGYDEKNCADKWILIPRETSDTDRGYENDHFVLKNNQRHTVPVRIVLPRRIDFNSAKIGLPTGQYVFNVDVYSSLVPTGSIPRCDFGADCTQYFSKKKLYVTVE